MSDARDSSATVGSPLSLASDFVLRALDAACVAAAAQLPRLRTVDQPGSNALVTHELGSGATITVTRGMLESLGERGLAVVFVNLLSRLEAGIGRVGLAERHDSASATYSGLLRANGVADAFTLLRLRDPEQVLDAMYRVALCDNRVDLPEPPPSACFYTWPYAGPPHDLPDRIRDVVSLAGPEGEGWWRELHISREQRAGRGGRQAFVAAAGAAVQRSGLVLGRVLRGRLAPVRGQWTP